MRWINFASIKARLRGKINIPNLSDNFNLDCDH